MLSFSLLENANYCLTEISAQVHATLPWQRLSALSGAPDAAKRRQWDFLAFTTCPNQVRSTYRQAFNYMQARKI